MQDLIDAIRKRNVILFVGAGVSMSLGLPSWDQLISYLAKELGYDVDVFKSLGDYLTLAEYYEIKKATIGSLRSWMDTNWHNSEIKIEESKIHKLIVDLDFPMIYTTNYDRWIERAFKFYGKPAVKIANVGDITKIQDNYTQIIKLHGDFDDDKSIVLTESSYFERLSFESPIDIKLRSDILGKSILFIGYSLNDLNIRYLFYKLNKLWESSTYACIRPKSYIYLNRPNPIQEEVLRKRGILTFVSKEDDIEEGLEKFLSELVYEAFGDKL